MKKKFILMSLLCTFMLFILTGCGDKTLISTNEFKSYAEGSGYELTDVTEQYAAYGYIKEATIAYNDEYQIEFYVLDSEEYASSMFESNKELFEATKSSSNTESSSSSGNYEVYTLTTNGKFMRVCRVENTLLYVNVDSTYKDSAKSFIEKLGY